MLRFVCLLVSSSFVEAIGKCPPKLEALKSQVGEEVFDAGFLQAKQSIITALKTCDDSTIGRDFKSACEVCSSLGDKWASDVNCVFIIGAEMSCESQTCESIIETLQPVLDSCGAESDSTTADSEEASTSSRVLSDGVCPPRMEEIKQAVGAYFPEACRYFDTVLFAKGLCNDAFISVQRATCSQCREGDTSETCLFVYVMEASCESLTCDSIIKGFQQLKDGCCGTDRLLQAEIEVPATKARAISDAATSGSCPAKMEEVKAVVGPVFSAICGAYGALATKYKDFCNEALVAQQREVCSKCGENHYANETCIFVYALGYSCESLTCESMAQGHQQLKDGCCGSERLLQDTALYA